MAWFMVHFFALYALAFFYFNYFYTKTNRGIQSLIHFQSQHRTGVVEFECQKTTIPMLEISREV